VPFTCKDRVVLKLTAILVVLSGCLAGADAQDLTAERVVRVVAASEVVLAERRIVLEYLRTGNIDLAVNGLEKLIASWTRARQALAQDADPQLVEAVGKVDAALSRSLAAAEATELDTARQQLEGATGGLDAWRRAHGLRLLADCIAEISAAYAPLAGSAGTSRADELGQGVLALRTAEKTTAALARCDQEAPARTRTEPEFRRLIDGMGASLRLMPDAIRSRDADYLHRLIIEQRAFERLLRFRFG
jgi:hypothetical protein